jgi:hypothetical protein
VLTLQAHFEFDRFVNMATLEYFAGRLGWADKELGRHLEHADREDDAETVADLVMGFVLGGRDGY